MWLPANLLFIRLHPIYAASRVRPIHDRLCAGQQPAHGKVMLGNDGSHLLI